MCKLDPRYVTLPYYEKEPEISIDDDTLSL